MTNDSLDRLAHILLFAVSHFEFSVNRGLSSSLVGNSHRILLIQIIVFIIEVDLRLSRSSTLNADLVTFLLVLLLVEPAEWIDVAGTGHPWELAFTLTCKLQLTLYLIDYHLLEGEDVRGLITGVFVPLISRLLLILVEVDKGVLGGAARA